MGWDRKELFVVSDYVERGEPMIAINDAGVTEWHIHPSDWLLQQGKGRFPFETRHCMGIRELERDCRRYPR